MDTYKIVVLGAGKTAERVCSPSWQNLPYRTLRQRRIQQPPKINGERSLPAEVAKAQWGRRSNSQHLGTPSVLTSPRTRRGKKRTARWTACTIRTRMVRLSAHRRRRDSIWLGGRGELWVGKEVGDGAEQFPGQKGADCDRGQQGGPARPRGRRKGRHKVWKELKGRFADECKAKYYYTSAKSGKNADEIFRTLATGKGSPWFVVEIYTKRPVREKRPGVFKITEASRARKTKSTCC